MATLADGFLALPGGAGTLEEIFGVRPALPIAWTWLGLGDVDSSLQWETIKTRGQLCYQEFRHVLSESWEPLAKRVRQAVVQHRDPHCTPAGVVDKLAKDIARALAAPDFFESNSAQVCSCRISRHGVPQPCAEFPT
jgi:hypothetical protein